MAKKLSRFIIVLLVAVNVILLLWILLHGKTILLLSPHGIVAHQEKQLFLTILLLGLLVITPTVLLFYFFAFRYGENRVTAKHNPDMNADIRVQVFFWAFSSLIVAFLIGLIWISTHALDPFRPLQANAKPITIQVVALQWKWLFIYPEQHIATVNYVAFPEKTPITFELTADAPMNSFWIPQLGGQMYAMEGMVNRTHLMADTVGSFPGSTAEISGKGFASMRFTAQAMKKNDFDAWVTFQQSAPQNLDWNSYKSLAKPSENNKPTSYSIIDGNLYNEIVAQFMAPSTKPTGENMAEHTMQGMEMNQ